MERIATLAKDILSSFNSASSSHNHSHPPPLPSLLTPKSLRSRKPSRVNRGFSLCERHQIPLSSPRSPHPILPPLLGALSQRLHSHTHVSVEACAGKQIPQGHFHPEPLHLQGPPTDRRATSYPVAALAFEGTDRHAAADIVCCGCCHCGKVKVHRRR